MNILASYDWLKQYVDLGTMTAGEFASRVSLSGPGVERLYPQGADLERIVLGRVLEVKPHPNADKLRLAVTDLGAKKATIVCGGSNLEANQWVAVAKEGAMVRWHGEGEPIELKPAEIRGVKSEGMICAANEIGLFDAFPHGEREILDLGIALPGLKMKPGTPLADVLGLNGDTLMDIEVTTNRPDAFSLVGLAREASAILKKPLAWKPTVISQTVGAHGYAPPSRDRFSRAHNRAPLRVTITDKKSCPRYMAVKIEGVTNSESPWWLKRRLTSAGLRPINALVDITNYVMLELGQPMHAFDADKLTPPSGGGAGGGGSAPHLVVRKAVKGESFKALDGKTYKLDDSMLVIADAKRPHAVAGVMGGETAATTGDTRSVIFEAATFDPVSVRKTARALNLYSDSQLRFEKGLSTEAPPDALARAVELCLELCGGSVVGAPSDIRAKSYKPAKYSITFEKINELIGVEVKPKACVDTLKRLGFKVDATRSTLRATVPWWRDHDIEDGRDLVEEIARVYGYANLPAVFPAGTTSRQASPELALEHEVRGIAKGAGFTETFTYSFVSRSMLERVGYDPKPMLRVQNPLSADFEFMRTSLLPSLVDVVIQNQDRFREQKLFEVQNVYYPTAKDWKELPEERLEFGGAVLGGDRAWREAKGLVEHVLQQLNVTDVIWKRLENDAFWHPGRTAQAWKGTHLLATVGELHPTLAASAGIEGKLALVDMPLDEVFHVSSNARHYAPIPTYPVSKRDLAFVVSRDVEAQDVARVMRETDPLVRSAEWFDTYAGKGIEPDKKSIAFRLEIGADDRTLEAADVDAMLERVKSAMERAFKASVRG